MFDFNSIDFVNDTFSYAPGEAAYTFMKIYETFAVNGYELRSPIGLYNAFKDFFGIEIVFGGDNVDFSNERYIITSNHSSDFDVFLTGLIPYACGSTSKTHVIAKKGWTDNEEIMRHLKLVFDFTGVNRDSTDISAMRSVINHLSNPRDKRNMLVFLQGTISDINNNHVSRIEPLYFKLSLKYNTPILPVFIEFPKLGGPLRIVIGRKYFPNDKVLVNDKEEQKMRMWIEQWSWKRKIIELQNSLSAHNPARPAALTPKHETNNMPWDPNF